MEPQFFNLFRRLYGPSEQSQVNEFLEYMDYKSINDIPKDRRKLFIEIRKLNNQEFDDEKVIAFLKYLIKLYTYLKFYEQGGTKVTPLTRKDILEICNQLESPRDKALLLGVYEGVCGDRFVELTNLKPEDIKNGKVYIESRDDEIPISKELEQYFRDAYEKENFIRVFGLSEGRNLPLVDDGTVFKTLDPDNYDKSRSMATRFTRIFQSVGIEPPTVSQFKDFSKLNYIYEHPTEGFNGDLKKWFSDKNKRQDFIRQFGIPNFNVTHFTRRVGTYNLNPFNEQ